MATLTTNYELIKPSLSDPANIEEMNPNWDKIDTELANRAKLVNGKVPSDQLPSVDLSGKVSKTGDTLTGALQFNNKDTYRAFGKTRTHEGNDYYVNFGCGIVGGQGCVSMEIWNNSEDGTRIGRLEIGAHGVSYIDPTEKRTYLYRNTAVAASVES